VIRLRQRVLRSFGEEGGYGGKAAGIGKGDARSGYSNLRVLIVGNYPSDEQRSMMRFAELVESGLRAKAIRVETIRPKPFFGLLANWRARGLVGKWLGYIDKFLLFPFVLRRKARDFDLIHIVDHSNAMYRIASKPTVVTCHDLLAIRSALGEFPQHPTGFTGRILQRWILGSFSRADHIVCDSSATRDDVLRLTGRDHKDISVAFPSLAEPFQQLMSEWILTTNNYERRTVDGGRKTVDDPRPYLIHVGGDAWYKNRQTVLHVFAEIQQRLGRNAPDLVLVGPPIDDPLDHITVHESVSENELIDLYRNAALLLFPSLGEGFGWPLIEAQALGCPVVTTGRLPLTEIGGDGAIYLRDPTDAESAADVVINVLTDQEKLRELRKKGFENARRFTGTKMIDQYADVYRAILLARNAKRQTPSA
jgi:glycosyltransferase involved in cell wall biosynthesis